MEWLQAHYIEIFGAITGILYVFLEIRQNIWLWPLGIITSILYIWIFNDSGFYADMGLQWYYLFISFYGWYWWRKSKVKQSSGSKDEKGREIRISRINIRTAIVLVAVFLALFVAIWAILASFTDSAIPAWDAFTTALSIVATWMLARKIIEHWILWIIADMVSIGLYIYKGLYPTVILFVVYTIMAFIGYIEWKKDLNRTNGAMKMDGKIIIN